MSATTSNNIKLGLLVIAGLVVLISTLYIIGKNKDIFGSHFELRARFANANGLMAGNNIRFSGIQAGTVKSIRVIDDTTIETVLLIDNALKPYINSNAETSIGTEGLIGNKIVNIIPLRARAPLAQAGSLLPAHAQVNTDEMLQTLDRTNRNLADISEGLRATVQRINASTALWRLLNDRTFPDNLNATMLHLRTASAGAEAILGDLRTLTANLRAGKGSAGALLTDTTFAHNLNEAILKFKSTAETFSSAGDQAGRLVNSARSIITDSAFTDNLYGSLSNIRKGTATFEQDMEALKHHWLLRGYFRQQEKAAKKRAAADSLKAFGTITAKPR